MATLLTGVGYIGATLLSQLLQAGAHEPVVALDNFYSTSREAIERAVPSSVRFIEGDVADAAAVGHALDLLGDAPDPVVFHLAAQPSAALAVREPCVTERSNLVGARVVLEAARERGARVVFGGSFRVYGDDLPGQTVDERTPYGRVGDLSHLSKIYVEQLARMIGLPFVSVRLGITYGLSPIMKTTPAFMTVPNLFCQRAARGDALQVLEDRPMAFIHVRDAAEALLAAARLDGPTWQVVNAAPEVATVGQVARTVQRLAHDRHISAHIQGAASCARAHNEGETIEGETGFRVRSRLTSQYGHTLQDSLGQVLDFFVARP